MFEKETIELYNNLRKESLKNIGDWMHSPVEDWKSDYFDKNFNEKNLINFRRTPLSEGLISFPDRPLKYIPRPMSDCWFEGIPFWQKVRGIRDIILELYRLRSFFRFKFSEINDNLIGNPCCYKIGKTHVTSFSIKMFFYNKYIEKNFSDPNNINILEIGGGCGGICQKLFSSEKLDVNKYVLIELPEIIPLAYWYLKNSGLKVFSIIFDNDLKTLKEEKAPQNVFILAPWMLSKIDNNFDLFINTMSFNHMTKKNINYYFSEIDRLNVKNLFLVNRDTIRDPSDIKISDYPVPNKYQLLKEEKYPFSKHLIKIYKLRKNN